MIRHAPQLAVGLLCAIDLLVAAYAHGLPRTDRYNFWDVLQRVAVLAALLWWGGFWR